MIFPAPVVPVVARQGARAQAGGSHRQATSRRAQGAALAGGEATPSQGLGACPTSRLPLH